MDWSQEAQGRLHEAGFRAGAARARLIEHLAAQRCCRSAQEIHDELAKGGHRVGLASVYRVLDTLAEFGLVQRVDIGDGTARYEPARRDRGHHHHLVCGACGKVEPFADPRLERAIGAVEERSGYTIVGHEVVLHGACADCR